MRRFAYTGLLTLLISFTTTQPVQAQTTLSWNSNNTDWFSPLTWSPGSVPTSLDHLLFQNFTQVAQTPLPSLSSNAVAGSLFFDMNGVDSRSPTSAFRGNGNTLTLGTGGAMDFSPLRLRGGINLVNLNNIRINLAAGTTLTGAAADTGFVDLGQGSQLFLTSGTRLEAFAPGGSLLPITIRGGGITLDATSSLSSKTIRFFGGQLSMFGGTTTASTPGVTTFGFGGIEARSGQINLNMTLGSATGQIANRIDAFFGAPGSPGLSLTFPTSRALVTFSTPTPTVPFPIPARVFFDGFGSLVTNGVIRDGGTPYVTLNNRWATYDPTNGLVPAATITRNGTLSSGTSSENVLVTSTTAATLSNPVTVQTLVVENSGLNLNLGGNTLFTNGLIFNGSPGTGLRRLNISNGNLFGTAGSVRHIVVNTGGTEIVTNTNLAGGGAIAKSGSGLLVLDGAADQLAFANGNTDVTLNSGQLRAVISGPTLNFGTSNVLQFRGGFLAPNALTGTTIFNRPLGTTAGSVNWATGPGDFGGGGFAAFNGNLTVDIGGNAEQLEWDGQTGSSRHFIRDGSLLQFNTPAGTGVIEFRNPIALDSGTPGNRTTRVIQALGNVNFRSDLRPPAERTRFTGVISGSSSTNLSFVPGSGVIELANANTYAGDTYIGTATVLSNTTGSATGSGNVMIESSIFGTGTIAPGSGKIIQIRSGNVFTQSDTGPSTITFGSAGTASNITFGLRLSSQPGRLVTRLTPTGSGLLRVLGTGQLTIETGAELVLDPSTDFTPTTTTTLGIIDNQTPNPINGLFTMNGVAVGQDDLTFAGNWRFRVSYTGRIDGSTIFTTGGNDLVVYNFTPVPEPLGVLLVSGLLAGLANRFRRVVANSL
ncbi:MAG: beta strand repeat-containing protein [Fimbriiglobus sp.]